jgi:hypothetical protein
MLAAVLFASLLSVPAEVRQPPLLDVPRVQKSLQLAARRRAPKKAPPKSKEPPPPAAAESVPAPSDAPAGAPLGRSNRIEFEGQLIKGQTTKAGEVQILERKDSEIKSMVKRRTSYREEIIKSVFPTVP